MKILFSPCHYFFDQLKHGSEYSWAFNIADRIGKKFPESVVVTGYKNGKASTPYKVIEVHRSKGTLDMGSVSNALVFNLRSFFATQKILTHEKFDIVHHVLPFGIDSTFDLSFLFNKTNTPLIIGPVQAPPIHFQQQWLWRKLLGYLVNRPLSIASNRTLQAADRIIVVSDEVAKLIRNRGVLSSKKIVVIPPGIDTQRFKYTSFRMKRSKKIRLLVVCYLIKRKAVDMVIYALKDVTAVNSDVDLRIVGEGPEKKNLQKLVSDLNLTKYVFFEGLVSHDKIQNYYRKSHIFLNMSRSEGFATVCLEAMSSGLAVISSKVGGFSEAIRDGKSGFLVEQGDYMDMARKIRFLLKNPEMLAKFGKNARSITENYYDWDKCIIPKYIEVYRNVLNVKS